MTKFSLTDWISTDQLISNLSIKFGVAGPGSLKITIRFDGEIIFDRYISDQDSIITVVHRFMNFPRGHNMVIEIDGKKPNMTLLDERNNIVSDTVFEIHKVCLNRIDLGEIFYLTSQYQHTHNGASELVTQTPSDICGFNGKIAWSFYAPVHKWLYDQALIDSPDWIQRWKDAWPQTKKNIQRKISNTFGIDIVALFKIVYLPKYLSQLMRWKRMGGRIDGYEPILVDFSETEAGVATGGYFYQDIVVANHIFKQQPQAHVTVGSNITGFVGHVATFMPITVCDLRTLDNISYPNITFKRRDLGTPDADNSDIMADSVSCLSCLHHIGIGRYGDQINPDGPFVALANLQKMVTPGGFLYIGTSVGPTPRVTFNSSRQFTVQEILDHLPNFDLVRFDYYSFVGNVICKDVARDQFASIPEHSYGIFVLKSKFQ